MPMPAACDHKSVSRHTYHRNSRLMDLVAECTWPWETSPDSLIRSLAGCAKRWDTDSASHQSLIDRVMVSRYGALLLPAPARRNAASNPHGAIHACPQHPVPGAWQIEPGPWEVWHSASEVQSGPQASLPQMHELTSTDLTLEQTPLASWPHGACATPQIRFGGQTTLTRWAPAFIALSLMVPATNGAA
jgi:hypothetical protein